MEQDDLEGLRYHSLSHPKSSFGNSSNINREHPFPAYLRDREQDQHMPISNVVRIMRSVLPPHAKIVDDAKETVQECVSEFISFVTGEANERCHSEHRKTVTAEDILWAMSKLGFEDYMKPLTLFLNRHRELEGYGNHNTMRGEPFARRGTVELGPPSGPADTGLPAFPLVLSQGIFIDHAALMNEMNSYYRDNVGAGSSFSGHAALPSFDPFQQFKRSF